MFLSPAFDGFGDDDDDLGAGMGDDGFGDDDDTDLSETSEDDGDELGIVTDDM